VVQAVLNENMDQHTEFWKVANNNLWPTAPTVQIKIASAGSEIHHHSRLRPSPEEPTGKAAPERPHTMILISPSLLLMVLVAILLQLMR
jgi:hypothetical protein